MAAEQQQGPAPNHGGDVQASSSQSAQGSRVLIGRNAGKLDPREHPELPIALVGSANRSAQRRGVLLGIASGLLSGFISRRGLNLSRNASYLSGFVTGITVAYTTAAMRLEYNLNAVEASELGLRGQSGANASSTPSSATDADMLKYDLKAAHTTTHEAGVGGLHAFQDRGSTTRGDH